MKNNFKCEICKRDFTRIESLSRHIKESHKKDISVENYYKKYLMVNKKEGLCKWCGKQLKFNGLKGYDNFCYNSDCSVRWYNKNTDRHNKAVETYNKTSRYDKTIRKQNIEYWIKKGFNKDAAKIKLKEYMKSRKEFSLKNCILKYGEIKGKKFFDDRQIRWQNTLNLKPKEEIEEINRKKVVNSRKVLSNGYSKISQELFWNVYEEIKNDFNKIYFATLGNKGNNEYILKTKKGTHRCIDFYIPEANKCIEFDGTYWHGEYFFEEDEIREKEILETLPKLKILHITEFEFKNNPEETIKKCVDFLKEKFIESYEVNDYEVWTDDGWIDITNVHKTIPYDIWEVSTENFKLSCADEHIVIGKNKEELFVRDLKVGDEVITENGIEKVISVYKKNDKKENMFDLTINSESHTYFTNGILSHNSVMISIYLLHTILFNKDHAAAILSNKEKSSVELLKKIKNAYEKLPLWLQQGIQTWNEKEILLENGSSLYAASTSSDSVRSMVFSTLLLDEFAFVDQNMQKDFMSAVLPTVSSGEKSKIIILSTPNGQEMFYKIWMGSIRGENSYYPIKILWNQVPGRDDKWRKRVTEDLPDGELQFMQEYGCRFIGANNTMIDPDILEKLVFKPPIDYKWNGLMKIYEKPVDGARYILGVDVAAGGGKQESNYSVIQVLKINSKIDLEQVAVYRSNRISPYDFAKIIIDVSNYYNESPAMIENNADVGGIVLTMLWVEYEWEGIITHQPVGIDGTVYNKGGLGIRAGTMTKAEANTLLKRYIEKEWLKLYDKDTVTELTMYEEVGIGRYAAKGAKRKAFDDCVTSLNWAVFYTRTNDFQDNFEDSDGNKNRGKTDDSDEGAVFFDY